MPAAEKLFDGLNVRPRIIGRAESDAALLALVEAGIGIALLPHWAGQRRGGDAHPCPNCATCISSACSGATKRMPHWRSCATLPPAMTGTRPPTAPYWVTSSDRRCPAAHHAFGMVLRIHHGDGAHIDQAPRTVTLRDTICADFAMPIRIGPT
jgi:DNA-binding transcriptional LysR family regulator